MWLVSFILSATYESSDRKCSETSFELAPIELVLLVAFQVTFDYIKLSQKQTRKFINRVAQTFMLGPGGFSLLSGFMYVILKCV